MDGSSEELNLVEFNIIDNIIGSAVDDLLLKENTSVHQYDYNGLASLLLPLCRFCARENAQMVHISDVHLQIINDLRIPETHGTNVCTNICGSCNSFLEEFCKFRSVCEEGQKRIATLLAERHGMANFVDLKLDFTEVKKDLLPPTAVMDEPTIPKMLNAIQSIPCSAEKPGLMELVEDNQDLEQAAQCETSPDYSESILILAPFSPDLQPQISPQRIEGQPDACQYVNHTLEECNFIPQYEQQSFTNFSESVNQTDPPPEIKALPQSNESDVKDTKKPEARRRVVDGRLQWVCLDCEQVFGSCFQLKKHRRNCELVGSKTSKRIATLVCDICGETMSTESALTMHKRKHTQAKPNGSTVKTVSVAKLELTVCHVCGHTSKSRRALRLHMITHSNDKNVECPVCEKRFKRRRDLRIHLDVHSGRKYECDICGKMFLTKVTLRNHAKTHRDSHLKHECTVCTRQFVHPHQLQKHMVIHTSEYPYVCEICKAVFRTLGRFKRHVQKGHTLPIGSIIEQTELNSWDDLIEYQPEVVPCETSDDTASEELLIGDDPVCDTLPEIFDSFASDPMLDQASPEFAGQPDDDGFYYCYGSTFLGTSSVAVINR
uniref:C2H2-type domain-containing protein n=1 Tax=Anopheles minimus TaxID=112268 RepID=A0A182VX26_9DIPT